MKADDYLFTFEVNAKALKHLSRAIDRYVEKWPGGSATEQSELKEIQLGLQKALLDCQMIESN